MPDEALFDTTFFIDLLKGDPGAVALWQRVKSGDLIGYYSPVSITELWLSPRSVPAEEWYFDAVFNTLTEVPFTRDIARFAGEGLRPFPAERARRLFGDAIIGCTALMARLPLYTRNTRDLNLFAGATRRY
jgi:predicted nucleic acid-binding protein